VIYISHRGNLNGIIHERENAPDYIQECLDAGYECEIDLRMQDGVPHLGHDTPDHPVSADWLQSRADRLWIHVKEYDALVWLMENLPFAKFFCHEGDRYTLTSNGWVWSHDLKNTMTSKCIVPLLSKESVKSYEQSGFGAVCSDYIVDCVEKWR
jgi:hypothetical protein